MAKAKVAGLTKPRKSRNKSPQSLQSILATIPAPKPGDPSRVFFSLPQDQTAADLWRAVVKATEAYEAAAAKHDATKDKISRDLLPLVHFEKPYGTDARTGALLCSPYTLGKTELEAAAIELLRMPGFVNHHREIKARIAVARGKLRATALARKTVAAQLGLPALKAEMDAAWGAVRRAEIKLVLCGFTSPAAIIGALHLVALGSFSADLDDWPHQLTRAMAEPLLAKVPEDMAAAFNKAWPLDLPPALAKALKRVRK